jgi:ABC-type nitrate/sulfonate/bicarbonate transport system substrate-binding protein
MRFRRSVTGILAVLFVMLGLAACGDSGDDDTPAASDASTTTTAKEIKTVTVGVALPLVDQLPLYVAVDQGFFKAEGLDVKTTSLSSGDKIMAASLSGSVDIGLYTPDWVINAVEVGSADSKIFLGGSNVPVYSLIVGKDVKTYADLKGKRVAVSALKASDAYLMRKMLAANGLKEGDYTPIQSGGSTDRAAALKSGSVGGALIIPPFDQAIIDEGYQRLDVSSKVLTNYSWLVNWAKGDWLTKNKDQAVGYCKAWTKAVDWIYNPSNRAAAAGIIAKELKITQPNAEKAFALFADSKVWSQGGKVDRAGVNAVLAGMVEQATLKAPAPDATKYIDAGVCSA